MARKTIKAVSIGSHERSKINDNFTELYTYAPLSGVTATAAELNYLDISVLGTGAESKAVVLDAGGDYIWPTNGFLKYFQLKDADDTLLSATLEYVNQQCDYTIQQMTAGTGFPGTGTIYKTGVRKTGNTIKTELMLDLTGAASVATDTDIIGTHATNPAHIGRITAALNGTVLMGKMTCLEVPVGGAVDIDLYSANEGTATDGTTALSGLITNLTETVLITAGGNWTLGLEKTFSGIPPANDYLYLCSGVATAGTYTAGKFLLEIWGY